MGRQFLKIVTVLIGSFLVVELYYQLAFRCSSILPSFLRIYDFRYFDSEGTPRFIQNTNAWHKSDQAREDIAIHINSHGFRGAEPLNQPSKRIIMIGDSTVFNGGIRIEKTFPFLTQEALRESIGDPRIEVLNFGVGDTNIRQYYLKLKNHALDFHPDLVLIFIYLNDTSDSLVSSVNATTRSVTTPWYHSFALEELSRLFRNADLLIQASASSRFDWIEEFTNRQYLNNRSSWERLGGRTVGRQLSIGSRKYLSLRRPHRRIHGS